MYQPAVIKCNGDAGRIIIVQQQNYCLLNVYAHFVEPTVERIIWIAFHKNGNNDKCLLKTLPKDLILYILCMLGKNQSMVEPYIKITI